jgi:DNA-directed RNA polymerase specialized sigma24 family protein
LSEASETLRRGRVAPPSDEELRAMLSTLPVRRPRRFVGDDELEQVAADDAGLEDGLWRTHANRTRAVLGRALASLAPDDRLVIRLRFVERLRVCQIASQRGFDQKALYRRFERVFKKLRRDMQQEGITGAEVGEWLGRLEMEPSPACDAGHGARLGLRMYSQDEGRRSGH